MDGRVLHSRIMNDVHDQEYNVCIRSIYTDLDLPIARTLHLNEFIFTLRDAVLPVATGTGEQAICIYANFEEFSN